MSYVQEIVDLQPPSTEIERLYTRLAPFYEMFGRLVQTRARQREIELAEIRDGESILEVASGLGIQLVKLARANPSGSTVGVDISEGMLRRAATRLKRNRITGVQLFRADARRLPFPSSSFDLVTNPFMLNLIPDEDLAATVSELRRVLRANGRLVISNMTIAECRFHGVWEMAYRMGLNITASCRGVAAKPLLERAGFQVVRREYMSGALFPMEIVLARLPETTQSRAVSGEQS